MFAHTDWKTPSAFAIEHGDIQLGHSSGAMLEQAAKLTSAAIVFNVPCARNEMSVTFHWRFNFTIGGFLGMTKVHIASPRQRPASRGRLPILVTNAIGYLCMCAHRNTIIKFLKQKYEIVMML
nr:hypothetical protein CFP56_02805 [Quercus suber]